MKNKKWWKILLIVLGGLLTGSPLCFIGIPMLIVGIVTLVKQKKNENNNDNADKVQHMHSVLSETKNTDYEAETTIPVQMKYRPQKSELNSEEIKALEYANKYCSDLAAIKTLCDDIDNGVIVESLYVYKSARKEDFLRVLDFPFLIYSEYEFDRYKEFNSKSARNIIDMCHLHLYIEDAKSMAKCQYWKDKLIELAEAGDFEAQQEILSIRIDDCAPFSEEEIQNFKQKYQSKLDELVNQENIDAMYARALHLYGTAQKTVLEAIINKTNGTHTDACYTYAKNLSFFDDASPKYGTPRFAELFRESYKWYCKGADAANGKHFIECAQRAANWAEDELIQDYETAKKYADLCLAATPTCPAEVRAQRFAKQTLEFIEKYHS